MEEKIKNSIREGNLFGSILSRFLPYWPLFVIVILISGAAAYFYLKFSPSLYEISATMLLRDENRGVEDSKGIEFLNTVTPKKIVENEIEVLVSRTIMKKVVYNLRLYAPVFEVKGSKVISTYGFSPVSIVAQDPESITNIENISISFEADSSVKIESKLYPLDKWVNTPWGMLKFERKMHDYSAKRKFVFHLLSPKEEVEKLLRNLKVTSVTKLSTVVNLKFKDEIPVRGEEILNDLIEVYNNESLVEKNLMATNTLAFVEDRIKIVAKKLDSIETVINQFKSQKGAVDLSEQSRLFLGNVSENDRRVSDIETQLAVLGKVEEYVNSKSNGGGIVPATLGVEDPVFKQLLERLSEAELRYASLRQTIPENNSILLSLRKEIDEIRPRILENIHSQQANLRASKANANISGSKYSSVLQTLPSKERRLLEISREQAFETNAYSFLLQKREEMALIAFASIGPESRTVDKAESSIKPVSPKGWLAYSAAVLFALLVSAGIVIVKQTLNDKILSPSDLEDNTIIPVAEEITYIKHDREILIEDQKNGFQGRQFLQLGLGMGLFSRSSALKKVLVTSGISGEGKTFVSANLASCLASTGKKVVLIDFNLMKPDTSLTFNVSEQAGIIEYLSGSKRLSEILKVTSVTNLSVIPAGKGVFDSDGFLNSDILEELFSYLESRFDFIVVDSPPIDLSIDAFLISEYCDMTLYIARQGLTSKKELSKNLSRFKQHSNIMIAYNGVKGRPVLRQNHLFNGRRQIVSVAQHQENFEAV